MMNFFFTTEIILFLTVFVLRIRTSMGISIHQYKRLEYMNDKIISEQNSLFTRKGSLIECVKDCASIFQTVYQCFIQSCFAKDIPLFMSHRLQILSRCKGFATMPVLNPILDLA